MARHLHKPTLDKTDLIIPVTKGGTNAETAPEAAVNLNILTNDTINQPLGTLSLNAQGLIDGAQLPGQSSGQSVNVTGPVTLDINVQGTYVITDYDQNTTYTFNQSNGNVINRNDDTFEFYSPTLGTASFTINGETFSINIVNPTVNAPSITSPVNNATNTPTGLSLSSSAFSVSSGSDTHLSSDWQVATDSAFTNVVASTADDTTNKTSWNVSNLNINTTYYIRVRHKGTALGLSGWSTVSSFTTKTVVYPIIELTKLVASDKTTSDLVGLTVAISADGTRVALGAPYAEAGAVRSAGAVYVFRRDVNTWVQESKIVANDPLAGDNFAWAVAIDDTGTRIVVGADRTDYSSNAAAYIFVRSGTTWTQEAKLYITTANTYYGHSVAIDSTGTRLAVGAQVETISGIANSGAVYVYKRTVSTWDLEQKITSTENESYFGCSVAIDSTGTRLAVGAYMGDSQTGATSIYFRNNTVWSREAYFSTSTYNDGYEGYSVSISTDGDRVASGAFGHFVTTQRSGKVYIYARSGTTWSLEATLICNEKDTTTGFGHCVSLNGTGDTLVANCNIYWSANGYVYIFTRSGTTWTQQTRFSSSENQSDGGFPYSVAISRDGKYLIAGAYNENDGGVSHVGAGFIYG